MIEFTIGLLAGSAATFLSSFYLLRNSARKWAQEQYSLTRQRQLHNANRSHPARLDAGPPARVHRAYAKKVRKKF